MIRIAGIKLPLNYSDDDILTAASKELRTDKKNIVKCSLFKRSIDARHKNDIHYVTSIDVITVTDENRIISKAKGKNISLTEEYTYNIDNVKIPELRPVVVGFGPAGMFASLILARYGAKPVILERGQDVDTRTDDVSSFWNERTLDTNSNVQFGEGGAGTFSDGKLSTGTKDSRIRQVLLDFVKHGAPKDILYNSKPHIGTDNLKNVVKNIRKEIISLGGEIHFGASLTGIDIKDDRISSCTYIKDHSEFKIECSSIILAIGHSSRDTFKMLRDMNIPIEAKPFSVGSRIEHLRESINISQYGKNYDRKNLPAADYKLFTHLKNRRTVYTFCMCPGGHVVAAASEKDSVVTNGMSLYARDAENSNSAVLVSVTPDDFKSDDVLKGMYFQQELERKAFRLGGCDYSAPVQRLEDFYKNRKSSHFGSIRPSYLPGTEFADTNELFPSYISESIKEGIKDFSNRLRGFDDPDALITSVESRSSSPVRILRDETMQSVKVKGLYPCGEGAGYAGGIMSAAVDGIKCAEKILTN